MPLYDINAELLEDDVIDTHVGVHDSNHFEIKLDYAIKAQKSRYFVDTYLFVPSALGINRHSYGPEHFYSDIQAYIRFKTPSLSLDSMADSGNGLSLLSRIRTLIRDLRAAPRDPQPRRELSYDLRLFGCIAHAQVRDRSQAIQRLLAGPPPPPGAKDIRLDDALRLWERLLDDIATIEVAWRALRPDFVDGQLPQSICETYKHVDEYISMVIELRMTKVIRAHDHAVPKEHCECPARRRAVALILSERDHRRGARYRAVIDGEDKNDHLVYHQGMLKKFVTSVLWLEVSKSVEGQRVADIGASIAAAVAMLFAVMATIKATHWWDVNTTPFIVAAVVIYVFKDRIKDWIKAFWGVHVSPWLADYSVTIRDPVSFEAIGKLREDFTYLRAQDVPPAITKCRHSHSNVSIEAMAKPEVVLKYSKAVALDGRAIVERLQLKDSSLSDILRFSLSHFLSRADDPKSVIPYYAEDKNTVQRRRYRKVYHLNVVLALRADSPKASPVLKRVRVVFDKTTIRELHEIT